MEFKSKKATQKVKDSEQSLSEKIATQVKDIDEKLRKFIVKVGLSLDPISLRVVDEIDNVKKRDDNYFRNSQNCVSTLAS